MAETERRAANDAAAQIAALRQEATEVVSQSESRADIVDAVTRQEADDRSMITGWVMKGFGIAICCIFGLLIAEAVMTGDWSSVVTQAVEILKSVILPVVTLVLGYYFGRAAKGG